MAVPGRCYRVGGAVRDALLGQVPGDIDWVVVGATPQAMLDAGFKPVGRDFPVFLHPVTHDEVALARTERKSGPGYRGFVVQADPSVTLEDDLARRDLTINAMAQDEQGLLIDPYGGQVDLAAGVLRHVSPAFLEDPVRLLRLARFAARWPHFTVAPETMALMQAMVIQGEVDALVPERVWQELARGLMENQPSRMLDVLQVCGAAGHVLPGLGLGPEPRDSHGGDAGTGAGGAGVGADRAETRKRVLDHAADLQVPLAVRAACLLHGACEIGERWRVPREVQDLAVALQRELALLSKPPGGANQALTLLERCDAWRRPERMKELVLAAQVMNLRAPDAPPAPVWTQAHKAALAVDTAAAARTASARGLNGPAVGQHIRELRLAAVAAVLAQGRAR